MTTLRSIHRADLASTEAEFNDVAAFVPESLTPDQFMRFIRVATVLPCDAYAVARFGGAVLTIRLHYIDQENLSKGTIAMSFLGRGPERLDALRNLVNNYCDKVFADRSSHNAARETLRLFMLLSKKPLDLAALLNKSAAIPTTGAMFWLPENVPEPVTKQFDNATRADPTDPSDPSTIH